MNPGCLNATGAGRLHLDDKAEGMWLHPSLPTCRYCAATPVQ